MAYPAFLDNPILIGSSYNLSRVKELSIITHTGIKRYPRGHGFILATYKDI